MMKFLKEKLMTERNIGSVIFLFAAILSYSHTLDMFERSGYKDIFAHIGTLACEALFLMGVVAMNRARKAGIPVSRPSRVAFILGGLIVLYSNVSSGLANGHAIVFYRFDDFWVINEVMVIGVLIPCIVFVSEMVVSYSYQSATNNQDTRQNGKTTKTETKTRTEVEETKMEKTKTGDDKRTETEKTKTEIDKKTKTETEKTKTETKTETEEVKTRTEEKTETVKKTRTSKKTETETEEPKTKEAEKTETEETKTVKKTSNVVPFEKTGKKTYDHSPENLERMEKFYRQNIDRYSIRQVAQMFNVSKSRVEKLRKELEQELSGNQDGQEDKKTVNTGRQ